jgi:hypothetical protein
VGFPRTGGLPPHRRGSEPATVAAATATAKSVATATAANTTATSSPINIWWHLIWMIQYNPCPVLNSTSAPIHADVDSLPSSSRGPSSPGFFFSQHPYPTHTITLHALVTLSLASYPPLFPHRYVTASQSHDIPHFFSTAHENASKSKNPWRSATQTSYVCLFEVRLLDSDCPS